MPFLALHPATWRLTRQARAPARLRTLGSRAPSPCPPAALKLYFDRAAALFLLYRFERQQLQEYLDTRPAEDARPLCQVYGAEHLLRLFIKLPSLLAHAHMAAPEAAELGSRLSAVVEFLAEHRDRLFTSDYVRASAEYANDFAEVSTGLRAPWDD